MDLERGQQRRFSHEEMTEIIELASRLDRDVVEPDSISLGEMHQIAAELGIDPQSVDAVVARRDQAAWEAEAEATAEAELTEWRAHRRTRRWRRWRERTVRGLVLIGALFLFDLFSDGSTSWWYYPAFFIGIGIVSRTIRTVFNTYESDHVPPEPDEPEQL